MIKIFVDGACEPVNPDGIATYGFVVKRDGESIGEGFDVVGVGDTSNNVAEYYAAIKALEWVITNGIRDERIVVYSDSELLINQLSGYYAVRAGRILPLYEKLQRLIKEVRRTSKVAFRWIPSERNAEADALSRRAYENFCVKNPEVLQRYADHLATEKQKSLLRRLNVSISVGTSKRMASRLIDKRLRELRRPSRRTSLPRVPQKT